MNNEIKCNYSLQNLIKYKIRVKWHAWMLGDDTPGISLPFTRFLILPNEHFGNMQARDGRPHCIYCLLDTHRPGICMASCHGPACLMLHIWTISVSRSKQDACFCLRDEPQAPRKRHTGGGGLGTGVDTCILSG